MLTSQHPYPLKAHHLPRRPYQGSRCSKTLDYALPCWTLIHYIAALGAAPAAPPAPSAPPAEALHRLEAVAAPRDAAEAAQTPGFGLEVRMRPDAPAGASPKGKGAGAGGLLSRAEVAKRAPAAVGAARTLNPGADPKLGGAAAAEAALAADLALLQRRAQAGGDTDRGAAGAPEAGRAGDEAAAWRPPEGQKGDGRTSLNDLLGY